MKRAATIRCRELIDFLDAYVEESLAREERERFDAHLALCPACCDYLASYRETLRLAAGALDDGPPPADVPEDLVRAVLASRRR